MNFTDNTFSTVLTLPTILFCLGIYIATWGLDKILTNAFEKSIKFCTWWKKVGLPLFPILSGGLFAFLVVGYPYPDIVKVYSIRILFGAGCGFFATSVVQVIKGTLAAKGIVANPDAPLGSTPPPAK